MFAFGTPVLLVGDVLREANGVRASGVTTAPIEHGPLTSRDYATVRFEAKEGRAFEVPITVGSENKGAGNRVEILYSPKNPHLASIAPDWKVDFWLGGAAIVAAFAFFRLKRFMGTLRYSKWV